MSKPVIPMPVGKNITISKDGIVLYLKDLGDALIDSLPQWIIGICFILIGWKLSTKLVGVIERLMARRDTEPGLQSFLRSLSSALLKTCFVITGAGIMGLNTAGIVTILGAAGLAIGLALQGALSNFAGGVLILLFKPFKVG
ncbi:MAG: mechanosensitive ion channel family protein, partial [Bacteroidia bacterium]